MVKVGRNDPCPCGSGKKFKKCCLEKMERKASTPVESRRTKSPGTEIRSLVDEGSQKANARDYPAACDLWLEAWEKIKAQAQQLGLTLNQLGERYERVFFLENFVQDLEMVLGNAGLDNPEYFRKRIEVCREVLELYELEEDNKHMVRRAIAESYDGLGEFANSEEEYAQLVRDYPENPWSYIAWGDSYFFMRKDKVKAEEKYRQALPLVKEKFDRDAIQERLDEPALGV